MDDYRKYIRKRTRKDIRKNIIYFQFDFVNISKYINLLTYTLCK